MIFRICQLCFYFVIQLHSKAIPFPSRISPYGPSCKEPHPFSRYVSFSTRDPPVLRYAEIIRDATYSKMMGGE